MGSAIFAAARSRANALQRQKIQEAAMEYQRAQVENLKSAATDRSIRTAAAVDQAQTSRGQLDLAERKFDNPKPAPAPQPKMITLTKPIYGHAAGEVVSNEQLVAEGHKYGSDAIAAGRAATITANAPSKEIQGIKAEMSQLQLDISPRGPYSMSVLGEATRLAERMVAQMKNPSLSTPAENAKARQFLHLPATFRYVPGKEGDTALSEAAARYKHEFWSNHYSAYVAPKRQRLVDLQAALAVRSGTDTEMPVMDEEVAPATGDPPLPAPPPEEE
jgi:hypothetical protein